MEQHLFVAHGDVVCLRLIGSQRLRDERILNLFNQIHTCTVYILKSQMPLSIRFLLCKKK